MASKQKKDAFAAHEAASQKYDETCATLKLKYKELDSAADRAIDLVSKIEGLIESIRNRPWSYHTNKRKISLKKQDFIKTKELKREERDKNIVAFAAVGLLGGVGLFSFVKDICKRNVLRWIFCAVFIVVIVVIYLICKVWNRIRITQKAYKEIERIKKETHKNEILLQKTVSQIKKICDTTKAVQELYSNLKSYAGSRYKELSDEIQTDLGTMYNLTLALTELVNTQIGQD